jgi:hypothetical protein
MFKINWKKYRKLRIKADKPKKWYYKYTNTISFFFALLTDKNIKPTLAKTFSSTIIFYSVMYGKDSK